jgi:hypothetical protein
MNSAVIFNGQPMVRVVEVRTPEKATLPIGERDLRLRAR